MARQIAWIALLGAAGLSTLLSCSPAATQTPTQPSPGAQPSGPATTPATTPTTPVANRQVAFAADVTPILKQQCAMCHTEGRSGAGAVKMFDTAGTALHAEIKDEISDMISAIESGRMPKGRPGTVPAAQVQTLKDWQAAGAPNN